MTPARVFNLIAILCCVAGLLTPIQSLAFLCFLMGGMLGILNLTFIIPLGGADDDPR